MSPEVSMQIQTVLNSDIAMQLDECTPYETANGPHHRGPGAQEHGDEPPLGPAQQNKFERLENPNALFGIVQGGMYLNLREGR